MSNVPPPFQPNYGDPRFMQPTRTSGAAVTSLVLGILGCIPLVTGLFAVIFGLVGIGTTRNPLVKGRGMAIAGLILGLLNIVCWSGLGGVVAYVVVKTAPDRAVARAFVQDLAAGNILAAKARCDSTVTDDELQAGVTELQTYGTLQRVRFVGVNGINENGNSIWKMTGVGMFAKGPKRISITMSHNTGTPSVQSWQFK